MELLILECLSFIAFINTKVTLNEVLPICEVIFNMKPSSNNPTKSFQTIVSQDDFWQVSVSIQRCSNNFQWASGPLAVGLFDPNSHNQLVNNTLRYLNLLEYLKY
jgi:hypothetical protein